MSLPRETRSHPSEKIHLRSRPPETPTPASHILEIYPHRSRTAGYTYGDEGDIGARSDECGTEGGAYDESGADKDGSG